MYLVSNGTEQLGPGTGLVQRINWTQGQESRGLGCGCKKTGMGLFESGMDYSQWGWPELLTVGLGGYMLLSTLLTTSRAVRTVGRTVGGAYSGAKSGARRGGGRSKTKKKSRDLD